MVDNRQRLIFDTSGLNALAKDKESAVLTKCVGIGSRVRLTETNLAEVGSTPDSVLRAKLLNSCQRLVGAGECIGPYHWIVEQQVHLHAPRPDLYNWERVEVRFPALETEVARPEFLMDDSLAQQMCADFKANQKQFKGVFREAREKFPIPDEERKGTILEDVIDLSVVDKSHWGMAGDIYEHFSGKRLQEDEIRAFVKACPPARRAVPR